MHYYGISFSGSGFYWCENIVRLEITATFHWLNQRYAEKLKQLVAGFQPQLEVFAKINNAYVGIDGSARRLLAYPVKGAEHFFRFDEINAWRIVPVGKHNYRLEVLTSKVDVPVFSLVLKPIEVLNTEARLDTLLAT